MKKRFIGVIHLTPKGDGVIEILGEEKHSAHGKTGEQHRAIAVDKSPS